jgi:TRAP-type mannitol/chloroaromatic compound transport system permease large subunit
MVSELKLIQSLLLDLPFGPNGILLCILFATFILGFFLDWLEITLVILPLVMPVVVNLGFDPIWFLILFRWEA